MVMFQSTLFSAVGGDIDTSPGKSGAGVPAGNGRYVVADNGRFYPEFGTQSGNSLERYSFEGGSKLNPFIQGGERETFNMAGLEGGADIYGIMNGIDYSDSFFQLVRANAPSNAVAAIMRVETGPTGDSYGQDSLLFVNLTDEPLQNPKFGIGDDFTTSLLAGGYRRDSAFGGASPVVLDALPAGAVYTTLGPTGSPSEPMFVNASVDGAYLSNAIMNVNGIEYLVLGGAQGNFIGVPESSSFLLAVIGCCPGLVLRRQRLAQRATS
jgi:hypothetical protein